jgi:hypothetical protein
MVEHATEHGVICGSKAAREKREEGETPAGWQPPRASGRNITAEMMAWSSGNPNIKSKKPFVVRQMSKWFMTLPLKLLQE